MKCPYLLDYTLVQQTHHDYDEDKETQQTTVEIYRTLPSECARENCGAWHNGHCTYKN